MPSYSIYLVQVNTIRLSCKWIAALVPANAPLALVGATTLIVVALGLVLDVIAERPLLRLTRGFKLPRRQRVPA